MEVILGLPLTFGTIVTLVNLLTQAGFLIYDAYHVLENGQVDYRSRMSHRLADRCSAISEMLQGVDHNVFTTNLGRKMVQTLIDSLAWCQKYDRKIIVKRVLNSQNYRKKFKMWHQAITQDFSDLAHTMSIIKQRPEIGQPTMVSTVNRHIPLGTSSVMQLTSSDHSLTICTPRFPFGVPNALALDLSKVHPLINSNHSNAAENIGHNITESNPLANSFDHIAHQSTSSVDSNHRFLESILNDGVGQPCRQYLQDSRDSSSQNLPLKRSLPRQPHSEWRF